MAPERIFVSRFVGGAGAIEEFQLLQEGLRHVETTHLPRLLPVPMVVTPTGDILAIGDATDTAGVHSVWIRNGNVESLKFVSDGERVVRATGPVPPEDHIFTGTKGGVHKLPRPDASWRTDPLSDNTTQVRVNGLAHRLLQDNAELWIAADTGRVFRRLADGDPMGQQVLTPPNFSCIDADTPRLSLNLMDIAIPDNATYALIALEFCRELLVFDLDGGQCASTIPYEGTSLESLSRRVRVLNTDEGLEIWTVGENFIRHAYVR